MLGNDNLRLKFVPLLTTNSSLMDYWQITTKVKNLPYKNLKSNLNTFYCKLATLCEYYVFML